MYETKGFKITINSQNLGIEVLFEPKEQLYLPIYAVFTAYQGYLEVQKELIVRGPPTTPPSCAASTLEKKEH